MSIPLQSSFVYGPVDSRRLGRSLGINILPSETKFCLSNCLYCQYGVTNLRAVRMVKLPPAQEILSALSEDFARLAEKRTALDAITFSGNGEPTLHPDLAVILQSVQVLRNRYFPNAKIGILSDSSRVHLAQVREILSGFDVRYMKFDAGDPETYQKINQPLGAVRWEDLVQGLKALAPFTMQSLFIASPVDNSQGPAFENWVKTAAGIRPQALHLYTLDRPPADSRVRAVSSERLRDIAEIMKSKISGEVHFFQNRHDPEQGINF